MFLSTYTNPLSFEYSKVLNSVISADDDVPSVLEVFSTVLNFDVLLDLIIIESKRYCEQKS